MRRKVLTCTAIASSAMLVAIAAAPAGAAGAGARYDGNVRGGTATLKAKTTTRASFRFAIKRGCAAGKGSVRLKLRKDGRFSGTDAKRGGASAMVKGRLFKGQKAKGYLRVGRPDCAAVKRRFTLPAGVLAGAGISADLLGHYAGTNDAGRPISFDLVQQGDDVAVLNTVVDVDTECWDDYDGDGLTDVLLAHVGALTGNVKQGRVDVFYSPDDDTEFSIEGPIESGQAVLDVVAGGFFDATGIPNAAGTFECDSWGSTYIANLQR